jgi:dCTP deaminase
MGGTFPSQAIRRLVEAGALESEATIEPGQIQPASLDLTVSAEGYAVPGSMLPLEGERVRDLVKRFGRRQLNLSRPEILVRQEVYLVRLRERVQLPERVAGYANNKSSTGRIDLQTRLLCDRNPRYDKVPRGHRGDLWLEIIPKSFDVVLREGDTLDQIIFYEDRDIVRDDALREIAARTPLLHSPDGEPIQILSDESLLMTLDLDQDVVGFKAKKSYRPVDLGSTEHDASEYFEPIPRPKDGALFLSKEAFYIFSTYELVSVPPPFAVEMIPYDTSAGEFRAHYAGFFDPGFGYGERGEIRGTPAVLEVRPYEDDIIVRHRQPVCRMAYERLTAVPDVLYGVGTGSHYANQRGPRLSKFFR